MKNLLLEVVKLEAFYGDSQVLFDVDLEVNPGEVVGLVGRNGAGKSTTFRALMGFSAPEAVAETVQFKGSEIKDMSTYRRVKAGIGFVPEDRRIFAGLTVAENLEVAAGTGAREDMAKFVDEVFPVLKKMGGRRGDRLSGGEQQMLSIGRTLMTGPSLVLLDEPTEGLAPLVVQELLERLKLLKDSGIGMLVAEQNLGLVRKICDRAYVLESGIVRYHGTIDELNRDEDLWQQYISV